MSRLALPKLAPRAPSLADDLLHRWQTVSNVIALITGSIAAGLYGNIGLSESPGAVASPSFDFSRSESVEVLRSIRIYSAIAGCQTQTY